MGAERTSSLHKALRRSGLRIDVVWDLSCRKVWEVDQNLEYRIVRWVGSL